MLTRVIHELKSGAALKQLQVRRCLLFGIDHDRVIAFLGHRRRRAKEQGGSDRSAESLAALLLLQSYRDLVSARWHLVSFGYEWQTILENERDDAAEKVRGWICRHRGISINGLMLSLRQKMLRTHRGRGGALSEAHEDR